jgi:CheY-like chemotaxis protein
VLIVDDDPDAREVVAAILRHYGASVIVATSVSTALVALRREQVDVMVADLGMPIEDGYDLIRHVRSSENDKIARLPAAALTAYTTEEDRDRVLAAGFQFHLAKPVDPAVLVATVERPAGRDTLGPLTARLPAYPFCTRAGRRAPPRHILFCHQTH